MTLSLNPVRRGGSIRKRRRAMLVAVGRAAPGFARGRRYKQCTCKYRKLMQSDRMSLTIEKLLDQAVDLVKLNFDGFPDSRAQSAQRIGATSTFGASKRGDHSLKVGRHPGCAFAG